MSGKFARQQRGGDSTFFYAHTAVGGPAAISQATLAGVNNAPMFNPLSTAAVVPGNSSGIIPTGLYLAEHMAPSAQTGGGLDAMSTAELRTLCNEQGLSCRSASGKFQSRETLLRKLDK